METFSQAGSPVNSRSILRHVTVAAAITALGGLLFGYDTGVVAGALLFVKKEFGGLSTFQQELVTSLLLVGAVMGALAAGKVADRIGRRPSVLVTAAVFVVGVLLAAFTPDFPLLLIARLVIGLAVGSASMVVPLYIGEVAPPRIRGALVSLNQLAITAGILASYLVDYGLSSTQNWRLMFGLAAIPAVILFTGTLFGHESPHWLVARGQEDQARSVLRRVRDEGGIENEIDELRALSRRRSSVAEVLTPAVRPALVVGIMLAIFQQITGINTVIYYAPTLLANAGLGNSSALLANVGVGLINVLMTVVALWLLDRSGRRPLLLGGTAGMAVGMFITGFSFLSGPHLTGAPALIAIVGLLIYTGSFAVGLGPVFWLLIAEIYPLKVRGAAMSLATIANWASNFVVTISFLTLVNAVTGVGAFMLFGFLTLVALVYFWHKVPETKGRSLQQIERDLTSAPSTPETVLHR